MPEHTTATVDVMPVDQPTPVAETEDTPRPDALVEQELLVEDVSIDGMCGVY